MAKKDLVKADENTGLIPLTDAPDYLADVKGQTGLEAFDKKDFKVPRIKLLQPLNPEIRAFPGKAIPGEFWHTGLNVSLGNTFQIVPCLANKRVILWNPREEGGGILALSRDGLNWEYGANKSFTVKLKNVKEPVTWQTGKNVASSGLLEWGSMNPDDEESGPAATLIYEYLCHLPATPELSPAFLSMFRTAINNAKQFNTSLLTLRKPIQSVLVQIKAQEKTEGEQLWYIPQFELRGFVAKSEFDVARNWAEKYGDYIAEYDQDEGKQDVTNIDQY